MSSAILSINYLFVFQNTLEKYLGGFYLVLFLVVVSPLFILNAMKFTEEKRENMKFNLGIIYMILNFGMVLYFNYFNV